MSHSAEEKLVLDFLATNPKASFSAIEICRKAGTKRQFHEDPRWALRPLLHLRDRGLVEDDGGGHYCLVEER